jgi:hypothetical protein
MGVALEGAVARLILNLAAAAVAAGFTVAVLAQTSILSPVAEVPAVQGLSKVV